MIQVSTTRQGDHARVTVTTDDWIATLVTRHWGDHPSASRVYGAIDAFAADENALVDANTERGVSPHGDDDFTSQSARDAHMREYRQLVRATTSKARETLLPALRILLDVVDQGAVDVRRFSVKAGCACTCSPGFILDRSVTVKGQPVDIWFDLTDAKKDELRDKQ